MEIQRWMRQQWDRVAAAVAVVLGLLALFLGWLGVSAETLPAAQIPYLASGGLLGVFSLGIAAILWLSADLRDEWRKLDQIHQAIVAGHTTEGVSGGDSDAVQGAGAAMQDDGLDRPLVASDGNSHSRGRQRRAQGAS